jgi:uncharacterized SAM-binding protein YcdF (DUF218 family)
MSRRVAVGVTGVLGAYVFYTAWAIWSFPCRNDVPADAAIVLGASSHNGKASPVFAERINHGLDLYRRKLVRKLVFTGGTPDGEPLPLAEVAARYAIEHGVPASDIVLEPYSRITRENLQYAKQIAAAEGLRTFLVVSDPLHLRRALCMATDLQMDATASATPTTRYTALESRLRFLSRETYFYLQYIVARRFTRGRSMDEAAKSEAALLRSQQR